MNGFTSTPERAVSFERRLTPQPTSVREARDLVRELLREGDREDLLDNAVLLVSEVVTNALLHAGTPMELRASVGKDGLQVEVADGSPHLPVRRRYATTAGTGRGLMLLEQLVDDWGVEQEDVGKVVWFRLADGARTVPYPDLETRLPVEADPDETVSVRLLRMPLLLHSAWREHAEALLREYLLASLDDEGDVDPIQVHAEATDAIAILEEQVPDVDVDLDPWRVALDAVEPSVSLPELELVVPSASVASFETLDRAIDLALEMTADGRVLTPPTQPEIQAFRRWLCRQVLGQAAGAEPVSWSFDGDALAKTSPAGAAWAVEDVTNAPGGRLAADVTNRIVAVSPAALEILGYDTAADLVGQRLVRIVPERFRQAHIAGFTLYLLVGRQPLLGQPVAVSALRADGTEVDIELVVTERPDHLGRRLFLADIERSP